MWDRIYAYDNNSDFSNYGSLTDEEQQLLTRSPLVLHQLMTIPPSLRNNVDYVMLPTKRDTKII